MKKLTLLLAIGFLSLSSQTNSPQKVFDVHIHGSKDMSAQLVALEQAGVYRAAISTSWDLQNAYRGKSKINMLYGLMLPCPEGKVPYSLQNCYDDGKDWPSVKWVETQIKNGKINFIGEILSQYYGISSSDSSLNPYYALAENYGLPVGIHTGGAGPDHGSPNFNMEMGNPFYMENLLSRFPKLKVWIMHGGDQFYREAIAIMLQHNQVYADISVISNPEIVPADRFAHIMKTYVAAGLEDRLMFGSDNGDIKKIIAAVEELEFLSDRQKNKIFYENAERFFALRLK
ncbi:MAG TPA: amidohydrolase family protein [Chitinophagaceae bacterium]